MNAFLNQNIGQFMLHLTVGATFLLLLGCLVTFLLRRGSAAVRHRVLSLMFCGLLLLPSAMLLLPSWSIPLLLPRTDDNSSIPISYTQAAAPYGESATGADMAQTQRSSDAGQDNEANSSTTYESRDSEPRGLDPKAPQLNPIQLKTDRPADWQPRNQLRQASLRVFHSGLLICWCIGAALSAIPLLTGWFATRILALRSERIKEPTWTALLNDLRRTLLIHQYVALLQTGRGTMPMTWGVWRPAIGLPVDSATWSAKKRRMVLLHELAHIKRNDLLVQTTARLVCAIYWFHPLVWIALRRLRVERELACDDCVIACGQRPSDYADQLVDIARLYRFRSSALSVSIVSPSGLEQRVTAILDIARSRAPVGRAVSRVLLACILTIVASMSIIRIGERTLASENIEVAESTRDALAAESDSDQQLPGENRAGKNATDQDAGLDFYGDPLPEGAIARLGTTRFRQGDQFLGEEDVGHDAVHHIRFAPDGKTVFTGSGDGVARQWDAESGRRVREYEHIGGVKHLAVSPTGDRMASLGLYGTIFLWNVENGEQITQLTGHGMNGRIGDDMIFTSDSRQLLSFGNDSRLRIWEPRSGAEVSKTDIDIGLKPESDDENEQLLARLSRRRSRFSAEGQLLVCMAVPEVYFVDVRSGKRTGAFRCDDQLVDFAVSPDGKQIATIERGPPVNDRRSKKRSLRLRDSNSWTVLHEIQFPGFSHSVEFSPDSKLIAVGWRSGETWLIGVWDAETGAEYARVTGFFGQPIALAFSPDSKRLATSISKRRPS